MSNKNKNLKKQNPPTYMKMDLLEMQKAEIINNKPVTVKKFRLGIDKNNNPLITIDNVLHFMTKNQFDIFTQKCVEIAKKINPEVDYTK